MPGRTGIRVEREEQAPMRTGEPRIDPTAGPSSRRQLAVSRALDLARWRAEERVQRMLTAAGELLLNGTAVADLTVQEIVSRSGQSLHAFYQHFANRNELLLTVFDESVQGTAAHLRSCLGAGGDPMVRLHRFVLEYHRCCHPAPGGRAPAGAPTVIPAGLARHLLTAQPVATARAFEPVLALAVEVLDEAAAAGAVRDDLSRRAVAGFLLQAVLFEAFAGALVGTPPEGDEGVERIWRFAREGLGARPLRNGRCSRT